MAYSPNDYLESLHKQADSIEAEIDLQLRQYDNGCETIQFTFPQINWEVFRILEGRYINAGWKSVEGYVEKCIDGESLLIFKRFI